MWFYYYDLTTGRFKSEGSSPAPGGTPAGMGVVQRPTRARKNEMWDETTRDFVARPPKVLEEGPRDRFKRQRIAIFQDPRFDALNLPTPKVQTLRDLLRESQDAVFRGERYAGEGE